MLSTCQVMLDRLCQQMSVDLAFVKAELKRNINNIYGVFHKHPVCNQIKDFERVLDTSLSKISYQKKGVTSISSD